MRKMTDEYMMLINAWGLVNKTKEGISRYFVILVEFASASLLSYILSTTLS